MLPPNCLQKKRKTEVQNQICVFFDVNKNPFWIFLMEQLKGFLFSESPSDRIREISQGKKKCFVFEIRYLWKDCYLKKTFERFDCCKKVLSDFKNWICVKIWKTQKGFKAQIKISIKVCAKINTPKTCIKKATWGRMQLRNNDVLSWF